VQWFCFIRGIAMTLAGIRGLGDRWRVDARGSIAINGAIALSVVMLLIGSGLDYGQATNQRSKLQTAVDTAAFAAARELGMSDAKRENVSAIVEAVIAGVIKSQVTGTIGSPALETVVRDQPLEVEVTARQMTTPFFGNAFGLAPRMLKVQAVARIVGRPNICVLALDGSANGAISLEKNARVTGQNCAVYSNSLSTNAIKSKNSAVLSASLICAAGGKDGAPGNFTPAPLTDCPTFEDPLAGRPEPSVGNCVSQTPVVVTSRRTLNPGTYCGGLEIGSGADVTLQPGIYIIKDGPFKVLDGGRVTGSGVGLFLTGDNSLLNIARVSSIDLEAPTSGPMAGLLMFEARNQSNAAIHKILSDDARNLLGTIYLSRGRLHVDANNPIADKSAYTAIIARVLTLYGGPNLVLNSNYHMTEVPVPEGIRGAAQPIALVK
jgi:hypothetical protein